MGEQTNNQAKIEPKAGDSIGLVTGWGKRIPAEITKVHAGGRVDLVAQTSNGESVVINQSPHDPTATMPDSWHAAAPPPAAPAEAPAQ